MKSKQELRAEQKKIFENIEKDILKAEQKKIISIILHSNDFKNAKNIGLYLALHDEVSLNEVIEIAWREGKWVYIPKIEWVVINFYKITHWQDIKTWTFWIQEPKDTCIKLQEKLNTIYIPWRVFTKAGKRVWRGKGYYDNFFNTNTSLSQAKKIWVCFWHQIVDDFEIDTWDILMNEVITTL